MQAQNKTITLQNSNTLSVEVFAHKNSVNTVIRNLISNAIKFTPQNGQITVGLKDNPSEITVSVSDTGVGMSEDIMRKLFRIDTKHTTKGTSDEKGTCLGLILCKEFVDKNKGRIWVESIPNQGTTFYFTLTKATVTEAVGQIA